MDCQHTGLRKGIFGVFEAGDYFGMLNDGAKLKVVKGCGRFAGDCMTKGTIIIGGNAGFGAGSYLVGGTLVVKGNAGDRAGQMNKGGTILVGGSAGDDVGLYHLGGRTIVCGSVGNLAGNWLFGGEIFVGGKVGSIGRNARKDKASRQEAGEIKKAAGEHGIKCPAGFTKIVPKGVRAF